MKKISPSTKTEENNKLEARIEEMKKQHEHDAWKRKNLRWWKIFGVLLLYIIPIHLLALIVWMLWK